MDVGATPTVVRADGRSTRTAAVVSASAAGSAYET
jgi:hypothetical protein